MNSEVFSKAAEALATWRRPLLITHARPDGDALGSLIAMRSLLEGRGIDALTLLFDSWPDRYAFLSRGGSLSILGKDVTEGDLDDRDAVIILDTCSYTQLEPIADWLRAATIPKLAVDHHVTRDELADLYLLDESAAANCLLLYEWMQSVGWPIDHDACDALFVGMAMDTGWFRYANTDPRVLAAAADLAARGTRPHELQGHLFNRESPARIRLLAAALESLELLSADRLAVMTLDSQAFNKARATPADTEDLINEPLRIASVVVSILLVDSGDGVVRVSLRSKTPTAKGDPDIDVAAVAQTFGGGGHRRAAGARVSEPLSNIHRRITDHLGQMLARGRRPAS